MRKEFMQVCTACEVTNDLRLDMSEGELIKVIDRRLFNGIIAYIMENRKELPVEKTERILENTCITEHKVKFNLISDNEIKRLTDIEKVYNNLKNRGPYATNEDLIFENTQLSDENKYLFKQLKECLKGNENLKQVLKFFEEDI